MHFWVCLVILGAGGGLAVPVGLSVYIVLIGMFGLSCEPFVPAAGPVGEAGVKFPHFGVSLGYFGLVWVFFFTVLPHLITSSICF